MDPKDLKPNTPVHIAVKLAVLLFAVAILAIIIFSLAGNQKAHAQAAQGTARLAERHLSTQTITAGQTFATTSYADLAGSSYSYRPRVDPTITQVPAIGTTTTVYLKVTLVLDAIKATTTTGTCALYANGAAIAASARTIDVAAKNAQLTMLWYVAPTAATAQTVKIQCKSGDSAALTVNFGAITWSELS